MTYIGGCAHYAIQMPQNYSQLIHIYICIYIHTYIRTYELIFTFPEENKCERIEWSYLRGHSAYDAEIYEGNFAALQNKQIASVDIRMEGFARRHTGQ